jgi:glycosyltransferase involved in cell wall biosynthesis
MQELSVGIDARVIDGSIGGAQQLIIGLAKTLSLMQSDDIIYYFIVYDDHERWLKPFINSDAQIIRLPIPKRSARQHPILRYIGQTFSPLVGKRAIHIPLQNKLVSDYNLSAIHFPQQSAFTSMTPNLFHPHDLQHRHLPQFFTRRERDVRDVAYRYFCNQASQIIIPTQWGKDDLIAQFNVPEDKITVIPQPSVLDYYPPVNSDTCRTFRKSYTVPDKFLLYPARMWNHKNHLRLISAIALLKTNYQLDIPLVLCGSETSQTPIIQSTIDRLGLTEQVRWIGYVSPEALKCLYHMCHTVILPSLFEGWGFPTVEAMSIGKPLICADIPSLREVCGPATLYVNPYDVESIASAIFQLYTNDKIYREYVQRGITQSLNYSWIAVGQQVQHLYRSITDRN